MQASEISRKHAQLCPDADGSVSIKNTSKGNTIVINEMVLEPSCHYTLQHKDIISICGRRFRFEYSTCGLRARGARAVVLCGGHVRACGRRVCAVVGVYKRPLRVPRLSQYG
jgi:hypothetical protein